MLFQQRSLAPGSTIRLFKRSQLTHCRLSFVSGGVEFGNLVSPFLAGFAYDAAGYNAVVALMFAVLAVDVLLRFFMIDVRSANVWQDDDHGPLTANRHLPQRNACLSPVDYDYQDSSGNIWTEIDWRESEDEARTSTTYLTLNESSPLLLPTRDEMSVVGSNHPISRMVVLLRSRRLMAWVLGTLIYNTLMTAFDATLPLFVSRLFAWRATGAGAVFLTLQAPGLFGIYFGVLSDQLGLRLVGLTGFAIASPSLALLGLIDGDTVVDQLLLCVFLVMIGQSIRPAYV